MSQSGALLSAILDWSHREEVGFSAIVSTGSMLDVGWGDLIYYFGDDPHTKSILLYMESVGDARSFLSAAREVALTKPIIVIKAGRSQAASRAAASHTGALTGSDEVLDAAFRRSGVLRVHNIADLFYMAEVLGQAAPPQRSTPYHPDQCRRPGRPWPPTRSWPTAENSPSSLPRACRSFDAFLPAHWSHNNPIDVLGDADPERYAQALEIASKDPNSDGLLVILAPQGMTDPLHIAERLKPYAKQYGKPVLASWMGGNSVAAGEAALNAAGIPTFSLPRHRRARLHLHVELHLQPARSVRDSDAGRPVRWRRILATAGRADYSKRTRARSHAAHRSGIQAVCCRSTAFPVTTQKPPPPKTKRRHLLPRLGFPVVLKLLFRNDHPQNRSWRRETALAQRRSGPRSLSRHPGFCFGESWPRQFSGVTVQPMADPDGYELILGSTVDAQFGPVVLFGSGGQLVEVYRDRALALPPLNTTLAQRMMEQTKIFHALKGVRGRKPVNMAALEQLLVRFSQLVVEQRWIKEIDINPLLASPEQLIALDARIVLHGPERNPRPVAQARHPSVSPAQYVSTWKMRDGNRSHHPPHPPGR